MVSFIKTVAAGLALVSSASAVRITFVNQDDAPRKIVHWAAEAGLYPSAEIPERWVGPYETIHIDYPAPWWNGAFRSCKADQVCHHPAVRAEVCLNCNEGRNWFDVSAVDNHTDNTGIHFIRANDKPYDDDGWSGCVEFPCPTCYLYPNDERTKRPTYGDLTVEMKG